MERSQFGNSTALPSLLPINFIYLHFPKFTLDVSDFKGIFLTRHEANKGAFTLQVAQPHLYTPRVICSMSILKSEMTCPQLQWVSPQLSNPFACIYCQHLNQQSIMHMHNQRSLYNSRFNQRMVYNNMADKFIFKLSFQIS